MNYYNEIDPHAAAWLRGLIAEGLIPAGEVDERSITDVLPTDLLGYTSCHFFAGVGGWPLAGRLAGLPDDYPWWSGSCPCPPFSSAGKKKLCPECGGKPIPHPLKTGIFACVPCGHEWLADERHLYPEFLRLIAACLPSILIGEQVAGADGLIWLAGVRATLEALGYDPRASDLCAAGLGAPHIRQRIMFGASRLADDDRTQCDRRERNGDEGGHGGSPDGRGLGHADSVGCAGISRSRKNGTSESGSARGVVDSDGGDSSAERQQSSRQQRQQPENGRGGFWSDSRAILCRDGKLRRIPTQPGLFPLADGLSYKLARRRSVRPALLKGSGNAIVPELGAEFIKAFLEVKFSNNQ